MLTPDRIQVLFADLQLNIVARSKTISPEGLIGSACVLAECARLLGIPVQHSVVPENNQPPEFVKELAAATLGSPRHLRANANPFLDTATSAAISALKRPVIVISGFAIEVVVLHAALSAVDAGFEVHVPIDACGGMSSRTEDAALRQIERAGGTVTSVVTLVTAIAPEFADEPGKSAFALLQRLRLT